MQDRFAKEGLDVHRWTASTPETLTYPFANSLNPFQKACSQSHVLLWKYIIDNQLPYMFILEDDACFDKEWRQKLDQFCQQNTDSEWDAVFLNASEPIQPNHTWTQVREQYLTGGYILSLKGAEELYKNYKDMVWGPDWMTSRLQQRGHSYSYFPWLIIQEGNESTIGSGVDADHAKVVRCLQEIQYPLSNYYVRKPLRLAVIIPAYNRHIPFLKRCLDSIQAQTRLPDVVALSISNAQQRDLTIDLSVYSFPIRYTVTDRRQNVATNRNCAISLVVSDVDIIVCTDCDDEMVPSRLDYTERAFQDTECDFVACNYMEIRSLESKASPTSTDYKVYKECLIPHAGTTQRGSHMDGMWIPSDAQYGLIVKPECGILNPHIHHAHLAFSPKVWSTCKYSEDEAHFRLEDSLYGRKLATKGFKGSYLPAQLVIYHMYDK